MCKMHGLAAILGAAAMLATLHAGVLPVNNRTYPDGTPVLLPQVQKYEARQGRFALPEELTVSAPAAADNEFEVLSSLVKRCFPDLTVRRAEENAVCKLELVTDGVPKYDERFGQ